MTPFRIQCETCQTRLRVREEGFIGEVHACPRCGGMVLIVPPAEIGEASAEVPVAEVPVAEVPVESPSESINETAEQAAAVPLVLGLSETLVPDEVLEDITTGEPANEPVVESIADVIEAPATTTPGQAAWFKAMAPGLTAAALTLASGALWFVYGGTEEPTPAVAIAIEPTVDGPTTTRETAPVATTVLKPTIEEPPVEETPMEVVPSLETTPAEITPTEKAIEKLEPMPTIEEPIRVAVATPPVESVVAQLPEEFDPLDFDPETIDLVLRRGGVEQSPTPETVDPVEEILVDRTPTVTDRIDARLAEAARSGGVSVRRAPSSDTTNHAPTAPADRLLAQTLPEIAMEGVPLTDAIQLLSELSGVPLSLRPQELQLAGVDAHKEVSITGIDLTFGKLITQTLKPLRLVPQIEGAHVLLQRKGADTQRTVKHRLADLAGDDPAALEKLLAQIGPASLAGSIEIREGLLSLSAPRRTHYELLLLCERLRVARRLEQQSPYPRRLIAITPALAKLSSQLERRTTFSFIQPTRIRDVVNHWRRATDLTIWVDWQSLSDADLGPLSSIECSATNRPWSEALDGVLGPLGLAWAAADGQTLWIASREAIAANQVVEFYPVEATAGEAFAERIADEHPTAGVVYDDASHAVIVRGNATIQRATHAVWREL